MIRYIHWENPDGTYEESFIWPFVEGPFQIKSISGLGPVDAALSYTDRVLTNGAIYNRHKIPKRNIVMQVQFRTGSVEQDRYLSYKCFRPGSTHKMIIATDTRIVETEVQVEKNEPNIFSNASTAQISLISAQPYFTGVTEKDNISGRILFGEEGFTFPVGRRTDRKLFVFANSTNYGYVNRIDYKGDAPTGIKFFASGFDRSPYFTIYNEANNQKMNFSFNTSVLNISTIDRADVLEVSTEIGNRYARYITRDSQVVNAQAGLSLDSSWLMIEPMMVNNLYSTSGRNNIEFSLKTKYVGV